MSECVTVHFSLRSPYSWLALHRLSTLGAGLRTALRLVPVYPRAGGVTADPAASHARLRYVVEDASRIARAYGITMRPPVSLDVRWERPHAAWSYADEQGCGLAFAVAAGHARFARGRDLGQLDVMEELASIVGIDPKATSAAAQDPARHARIDAGITAATESGVIGVPFFEFAGQHFWGNDRLEWLLREIDRARGKAVPDLSGAACLAPPWTPEPA